jgi:hypothetical protein
MSQPSHTFASDHCCSVAIGMWWAVGVILVASSWLTLELKRSEINMVINPWKWMFFEVVLMCSHLWGWILLLRHQGFCSSNTCYQLTISPSSQLILQSSHQLTSSTGWFLKHGIHLGFRFDLPCLGVYARVGTGASNITCNLCTA